MLSDNCVSGTLPPEMGLLSSLQYIDLSHNGLSGFIPDDFYNLSMLTHLDLACQKYNGYYCTRMSCFSSDGRVIYPQMEDSGIYKIGLEGQFLEKIVMLQDVKYVSLMGNSFSGSIAPEIGNLKNLGR